MVTGAEICLMQSQANKRKGLGAASGRKQPYSFIPDKMRILSVACKRSCHLSFERQMDKRRCPTVFKPAGNPTRAMGHPAGSVPRKGTPSPSLGVWDNSHLLKQPACFQTAMPWAARAATCLGRGVLSVANTGHHSLPITRKDVPHM